MSVTQPVHPDNASKDRLRLWLRMLKASRMIETQLRENLRAEFQSTLPRFDVMAALSRYQDGLKMSQLSDVLRVSNGNVTGIVDRLADDGCVVRVPVPGDRRASLVRLTKRGHEEFAVQAKAHEDWINDILSEFSANQAVTVSGHLDALVTALEGKAP
ncbi:MarR family winged helix-turn-helix transcriptional regulator [Parasulfitobacter algicola]|uniref:MarR family transcriptional regulator n=1 Tax=Parasulfitobacter algicola TaxID=2614809 RepID=A0ABX2IW71_9RHOB|nr:MarR family transcriptional regulator [Sulfitobacter algicola]NSX56276.1 MarR family transcriptional regulator [Sulfitobacter algicola]